MSDLGSSAHGEVPDAADQDLEDFVQNPKKKHKVPRGHRERKPDSGCPRRRRNSSPDSNSVTVDSPPTGYSPTGTDAEDDTATTNTHKVCTKHNWISAAKDDTGGPRQFQGFSSEQCLHAQSICCVWVRRNGLCRQSRRHYKVHLRVSIRLCLPQLHWLPIYCTYPRPGEFLLRRPMT
jgi:hypothetical protein